MRDLIDERNRLEQLRRSIIKRANVHYVTVEELQQQEDAERKKRQEAEQTAQDVALRLKQKKEMEQRELLERAQQEAALPLSSRYGKQETDEVTKEQVKAILSEKEEILEHVIENTMHEKE